MNIQAELSVYPLQTTRMGEVIDSFVNGLERAGLSVHKGNMSTTLTGDAGAVFAAVGEAFASAAESDEVVLVMKASNACPSPDEAK